MTAVLYTQHFAQFFDDDGNPLSGGFLYTYEAGTTTPKATFTTAAGDIPNPNPIVLDAAGRATIFIDGAYKFELEDSDNNPVRTTDNVSAFTVGAAGSAFLDGSFTLQNTTDPTKQARFNVAEISSGQTRVYAMPATSGNVVITSFLDGYKSGCRISNNTTDANNDIDIAPGVWADSTGADLITLSSLMTKQLDAVWAVGTNQGGLDTGSKANSTWYHLHLIKRPDTGVVDVLFSTSATAPTLPTNYTLSRRIGSVRTDGSGNIRAFLQTGDLFMWNSNVGLDVDATNPGTSAVTPTVTLPLGVKVEGIFQVRTDGTSAAMVVHLSDPDIISFDPSISAWPLATNGQTGTITPMVNQARCMTNTSSQIRYKASASGASNTLRIATIGWRELF